MTDSRIPASQIPEADGRCCRLCGGPLTEKGNCARSVDAMRQAASPAETTPFEEALIEHEKLCMGIPDAFRAEDAARAIQPLTEEILASRQSLIDAYKKLERERGERMEQFIANFGEARKGVVGVMLPMGSIEAIERLARDLVAFGFGMGESQRGSSKQLEWHGKTVVAHDALMAHVRSLEENTEARLLSENTHARIKSLRAELSRLRALVLTAEEAREILENLDHGKHCSPPKECVCGYFQITAALRRIANGETAE